MQNKITNIFTVTTLLDDKVVVELGILHDVSTQEFKLFIRKCKSEGIVSYEKFSSKTLDFVENKKSLTFFNPEDIPERLVLEDVECNLTNINNMAILRSSIWGENVSIAIPNVDAVYF